jgi:hypothetical protein
VSSIVSRSAAAMIFQQLIRGSPPMRAAVTRCLVAARPWKRTGGAARPNWTPNPHRSSLCSLDLHRDLASPVSWSLQFDEPILLTKGKLVRTLRDAADHVVALPKAKSALPHWQLAVGCLMAAAEKRGPMMMARVAVVKALGHDIRS